LLGRMLSRLTCGVEPRSQSLANIVAVCYKVDYKMADLGTFVHDWGYLKA
jgi:hypothetical protein